MVSRRIVVTPSQLKMDRDVQTIEDCCRQLDRCHKLRYICNIRGQFCLYRILTKVWLLMFVGGAYRKGVVWFESLAVRLEMVAFG
jgi:hypothetical protein